MHFPELTPHIQHLSEYEQEFAQREYGRGLDYYIRRIDSLDFSGERVLDAGCGQGQWSIALAQRFQHVDAIDMNGTRLGVLHTMIQTMGIANIHVQKGSIDSLPYDDGTFDAVFCYDVIMFTHIEKVLREFYRVLIPGGRLYVCLNSDGWNWYLVEERWKNNPELQKTAREILFDSHLTRAEYYYFKSIPKFFRRKCFSPLLSKYIAYKVSRCSRWYNRFLQRLGVQYIKRYSEIAAHTLIFGPQKLNLGISRSYLPFEMEKKLNSIGFEQYILAREGELLFYPRKLCEPIHVGIYKDDLEVWEFCAVKPSVFPSAQDILQYARKTKGGLPPFAMPPRLSNLAINAPYIFSLTNHYECIAQHLGGEEFIYRLVKELLYGLNTEQARFEKIVTFVQYALMRHPLYQPLSLNAISPLAILLGGIGRCGHCVSILEQLLTMAKIETQKHYLGSHMTLSVLIENRWVLAEADIFKNGVIPTNGAGELLSMEDIAREPRLLDTFPPTGWRFTADTKYLDTPWGRARGYVAAQDWHQKGYVSSYFRDGPFLAPPSVPRSIQWHEEDDEIIVSWDASHAPSDPLRHYEV